MCENLFLYDLDQLVRFFLLNLTNPNELSNSYFLGKMSVDFDPMRLSI